MLSLVFIALTSNVNVWKNFIRGAVYIEPKLNASDTITNLTKNGLQFLF